MTGSVSSLPRQVSVKSGNVVIAGPDGNAIELTPDAALITSARLAECADSARTAWLDSHHENWDRKPRP
jgi:hypothetical protein